MVGLGKLREFKTKFMIDLFYCPNYIHLSEAQFRSVPWIQDSWTLEAAWQLLLADSTKGEICVRPACSPIWISE